MTPYPHLFSSITVGPLALPNRLMMGSMHTGLEGLDGGVPRLAAFYRERVEGGTPLIVSGGYSPNQAGRLNVHPVAFDTRERAEQHREITTAVHEAGGHILLQLVHAGRYGYHDGIVAPSPIRSPINKIEPRELTGAEVEQTIADFAIAAALARDAGYDGVEIMGSEGYLITQFLALRTNKRSDDWGGPLENRMRFALETVRAVREAGGEGFAIMFRISALDLVEDGLSAAETVTLARALEAEGADILDTGIGWHEARVPTIAAAVPRGAFAEDVRRIREAVSIPVIATNRINTPELAEEIIADGAADIVALARPLLADEAFASKARNGRADLVNTCIACNQACLDHYFTGQISSCLVNPRACHETMLPRRHASRAKRIAVAGAGPAGLACAAAAAEAGHEVVLFEAEGEIGGQFRLARAIPGKEEFGETIRHFEVRLGETGVDVRLSTRADKVSLREGFDAIVIAAGITPRAGVIEGEDHPKVTTYTEVLSGAVEAGPRVAVIGAGGIGFDVAVYLTHDGDRAHLDGRAFRARWGIGARPEPLPHKRDVTLLQRSDKPIGRHLGRSTGWIHRAALKEAQVEMLKGVTYERVDDDGLHVEVDGERRCLDVDTVVICAGQVENAGLAEALDGIETPVHVIGGARLAGEIDAKRAFDEGVRLASRR
jgi:2,4-dienoyl-CoA reductase (NADPH2)